MNPFLAYVVYDVVMGGKFRKIYFQWSRREKLQNELQRQVNIGKRTNAQNYTNLISSTLVAKFYYEESHLVVHR